MMTLDRSRVEEFLLNNGVGPTNFFKKLSTFFDRSKMHYRRLLIRDRIALHLDSKLDMTKAKDRRKVWLHIASTIHADDGTGTKWHSGETDPPIDQLLAYFDYVDVPIEQIPAYDRRAAWRFAIPRALLYSQVYPWPMLRKRHHVRTLAGKASKLIASSKYFKRFTDINQSSMDKALFAVPELELGVRNVAAIRERMETRHSLDDPLCWPFAIFKTATFNRSWIDKEKVNPYELLWVSPTPGGIWA
jgi:hypothetical protein